MSGALSVHDWPSEPRYAVGAQSLRAVEPESAIGWSTDGVIRVFTDLVPSSLLDLEPGASAALLELERAVSERPEFLTFASQLHLVVTR